MSVSTLSVEEFNKEVACYNDLLVSDLRARVTPNALETLKQIAARISPSYIFNGEQKFSELKDSLTPVFAEYIKSNNIPEGKYQDRRV